MEEPRFGNGTIVRSGFFHKYFPDGHEGQNQFAVMATVDRPRKGRMCLVRMIMEPNTVREIREDELELAP